MTSSQTVVTEGRDSTLWFFTSHFALLWHIWRPGGGYPISNDSLNHSAIPFLFYSPSSLDHEDKTMLYHHQKNFLYFFPCKTKYITIQARRCCHYDAKWRACGPVTVEDSSLSLLQSLADICTICTCSGLILPWLLYLSLHLWSFIHKKLLYQVNLNFKPLNLLQNQIKGKIILFWKWSVICNCSTDRGETP